MAAKDFGSGQPSSIITPELMTGVADVLKGVLPSLVGRRKAKGRVFREQKKPQNQGFILPTQQPQLPVPVKVEKPKTNYLKYMFWGVALAGTGYATYWLYNKYKSRKEIPTKQNPEVNPIKSLVNSAIDSLESKSNKDDDKEKKEKDTVINLNINNLNGEKQSVNKEEKENRNTDSDELRVNRPKDNETKESRNSRFHKFMDDVEDDDSDEYDIEDPHNLDFEEEDE